MTYRGDDPLSARGSKRDVVRAHREQIERNAVLARLRTDVPLPSGPRIRALTDESVAALHDVFTELAFKSLLPRLQSLFESR